MRPQYHLIASFLLALIFFYFTKSTLTSLLCFFSGFLIDLDHFIDFWLYKRKITFSKEFFSEYYKRFGRMYVLFHSFELVLMLWIFFLVFDFEIIGLGIILGMVSHLLMDLWGNPVHTLSYFFTYRFLKGFDLNHICVMNNE